MLEQADGPVLRPATAGTASSEPVKGPAQPAQQPFDRQAARAAAPVDAPALAGFRPVAGESAGRSTAARTTGGGPWSVAVDADAAVGPQADALRAALRQAGIEVRPPGARADAALVLAAGAPSAWFCDEAGSASEVMAATLARALPPSSVTVPPASSCERLQAGARAPGVLLTVPPIADAPFAQAVSLAVADYFARHGAAQRRMMAAAAMRWPAFGEITSHYGPGHPLGIDIAQASGPILAATDGVVFFAGGSPCCSYGRFVVIDGPDGIRTLYAHFDSIAVKTGERVKAGQVIGEVGCSGTCSGPHLHFEVFDGGMRRNPLLYLP